MIIIFFLKSDTLSQQSCPICQAKPSTFNKLKNITNGNFAPKSESALHHGISPLHMNIRFLEACLNLAYKLSTKNWRSGQTEAVKANKRNIQKLIENSMNITVDQPRSGGQGSSNTGNVARRFFDKVEIASEVTGLDEQLMKNLRTILLCFSSPLPIDPDKFEIFARATAKIWVEKYSWHPMPCTVHKVLIHGAEIIRATPINLGMLSEEASEAKNKFYRLDRLHHARKCSRIFNLEDMFNRSLEMSDPLVSLSRQRKANQKKILPPDVEAMLVRPDKNCTIAEVFHNDLDELFEAFGEIEFHNMMDEQ